MGEMVRSKIAEYISTWEKRCYHEGLPDEAPIELKGKVPSYKDVAIAILTNDHGLKSLGYAPKNSKYYSILKRIEIEAREPKVGDQLKLKLF